jgi:hypothetical protein
VGTSGVVEPAASFVAHVLRVVRGQSTWGQRIPRMHPRSRNAI